MRKVARRADDADVMGLLKNTGSQRQKRRSARWVISPLPRISTSLRWVGSWSGRKTLRAGANTSMSHTRESRTATCVPCSGSWDTPRSKERVRYLGTEVDDALAIVEQVDV